MMRRAISVRPYPEAILVAAPSATSAAGAGAGAAGSATRLPIPGGGKWKRRPPSRTGCFKTTSGTAFLGGAALRQGLQLVHFLAQRERFL